MRESRAEKAMNISGLVCLILCGIFLCITPVVAIFVPSEIGPKILITMLCIVGVSFLVAGACFCVAMRELGHRGER